MNEIVAKFLSVGFSIAMFFVGMEWLEHGGMKTLSDLMEHATGTYDWIHHFNPHHKHSDDFSWHPLFKDGKLSPSPPDNPYRNNIFHQYGGDN